MPVRPRPASAGGGWPARAKAAALGGGQLVGWYAQQVAGLEPETVEAWEAFTRLEPFWDGGGR